jgi:hypothetical protein
MYMCMYSRHRLPACRWTMCLILSYLILSYLILSYLILSYLSGGTRMTRGNKKPTPFYFCVVALEQKVALQPHLPVPVRCPASHGCTAEPHASPCLPLGVRP